MRVQRRNASINNFHLIFSTLTFWIFLYSIALDKRSTNILVVTCARVLSFWLAATHSILCGTFLCSLHTRQEGP